MATLITWLATQTKSFWGMPDTIPWEATALLWMACFLVIALIFSIVSLLGAIAFRLIWPTPPKENIGLNIRGVKAGDFFVDDGLAGYDTALAVDLTLWSNGQSFPVEFGLTYKNGGKSYGGRQRLADGVDNTNLSIGEQPAQFDVMFMTNIPFQDIERRSGELEISVTTTKNRSYRASKRLSDL